jgi:hypothetical protein
MVLSFYDPISIVNSGKFLKFPTLSCTLITMFAKVPVTVGVPDTMPVAELTAKPSGKRPNMSAKK